MSTKIYYAYRIKKSRFIEFLDLAHDQMFYLALGQIKLLMRDIKIDEKEYNNAIKKYAPNNKAKQKRMKRWRQFETVITHCKKAANNIEKSIFDIDCGLNIWLYNQYIYIIPIGPYWISNNLNFPEWVEDYSYWNNVDPPEDINFNKWKKRGDIWKKVCIGQGKSDYNSRRLYHSVIELKNEAWLSYTELQSKLFPLRRSKKCR